MIDSSQFTSCWKCVTLLTEQWCNLKWKGMSFVLAIEYQDNFNFESVFRGKESQTYVILNIFIFILLLEKEEEFDWGKYLMEGEEIYFGPGVDTPVSDFLR